jgi:hypothetical protein
MTGSSAGREWAPIRFHSTDAVEIPDDVRLRCQHVEELQAHDRTRFVASVPAVLRRLDLSRGVLTVMTCDDRFSILFANWAAACDRHGIDVRATTLVFATDEAARDRIESLGFVAYFDHDSQLLREMTHSGVYGDQAWVGYMYHQNWVIAQVLALGVDVLFQDVDVVWRHDPVPTLQAQAAEGAGVQVMYDGPNERFQPLYANSGFMYFRDTQQVREFWAEVCAHNELVGYYRSQQEPLNVILAAHAHRGLDVRVLDEDRFANGHLYGHGRTPPEDPWVVHLSWTRDLATKLERFAAHHLWFFDAAATDQPAPARRPAAPVGPKRIAILAIAATNQPVYRHYIESYWTDLIRHTAANTPHIDVYLLNEHGRSHPVFEPIADHVIEDPDADTARLVPEQFRTANTPGILTKTIHAFDVLADRYDVFFRTNLSSIVMLSAFDRFVQSSTDLAYSGQFVWRDALRSHLIDHQMVGDDRSVTELSELDSYPGNSFVSGSGFLLRADEARSLVERRHQLRYDLPDDVAIGLMFEQAGQLSRFSETLRPESTINEMLHQITTTSAAHLRLQHLPVERAMALWRYVGTARLWL